MSDSFEIRVQADSEVIHERSHGKHPIVCPIAVKLAGKWFPHESWDDFALVILETWHEELRGLDQGAAKLHFTDGPWMIRVSVTGTGLWLVEAIRGGLERNV